MHLILHMWCVQFSCLLEEFSSQEVLVIISKLSTLYTTDEILQARFVSVLKVVEGIPNAAGHHVSCLSVCLLAGLRAALSVLVFRSDTVFNF